MSLLLENDLSLDNDSFSQELDVINTDNSFDQKRRRRTVRRVSRKAPKGKIVYGKSGKRLKGMYVRK
jgi:hypothetical protein